MIDLNPKGKTKNKSFLYLRIAVSIILLIVLCFVMRGRLDELLNTLRSVKLGLFLFAVGVAGCCLIINGLRLQLLFDVQGIHFSRLEAIKISYIGVFFNNFMPSTVGGDVVKLYFAKKRAKNFIEPISSIIMDRILGLTSLTILGALALIFKPEFAGNNTAKLIITVFSLIIVVFFGLLFYKGFSSKVINLCGIFKLVKFKAWLIKVIDTVSRFSKSYHIFVALFFSFLGQLMSIFAIYMLSSSLSLNLPLVTFYILIPVIQIVSVLPSINGLGIREGAFVYFFKNFMAAEYAIALSILYVGIMMPLSLVGGLVYMFYGKIDAKEAAI